MLKSLVEQVKRLFSSKRNGGRLVVKLTDQLHYYKQVLLATCIALLLGYSQFRDHFVCQPVGLIDKSLLTNQCWINGTTTLDLKPDPDESSWMSSQIIPHVGMHFRLNNGRYQVLNHNYMRSIWALLILMAICSYVAQRRWAAIFNNDLLRAILKLPGCEDLPQVKSIREARPYETLMRLPVNKRIENEPVADNINILIGQSNAYNHLLDHYPDQLIYLLLVKQTTNYKLANLKLQSQLIWYSITSFSLTLMQFLLPLIFVGEKYKLYGINLLRAWLEYVSNPDPSINSLDYELSSRIWPTQTQCEYKHYGFIDIERFTTQCTVSINELCAKLFMIIWWFVAINIIIEFCALFSLLISALGIEMTRWSFGFRFWPRAREEAADIASFRYKNVQISEGSRKVKQLEAEVEYESKKWYLWCCRDVGLLLLQRCRTAETKLTHEIKDDAFIYYLLYLLHLRLNKSRKRTEQVINMTSEALNRYLENERKSAEVDNGRVETRTDMIV